jgi:MFS-type transporter involved in bile tolerance (Atg22 family)
LINLVGNVGSLLGPYVIGVIRNHNASVIAPTLFVTVVLLTGLVFLFLLRGRHEAMA